MSYHKDTNIVVIDEVCFNSSIQKILQIVIPVK